MSIEFSTVAAILLPLVVALAVSFLATPIVKSFACKLGAIDVPKDARRMHKVPIPRMGGLAIFLGFIVSVLLFCPIDGQMKGILLGSVIIVVMGIIDDITPLRASLKFVVQILAALIAVLMLWIVGLTNAVNLIDGLDGLAIGVSSIGALTMLVIAILVAEPQVALIMAALVGACIGFMPYNMNPAKIFMGDTGSTFLGYILACITIQGLFKFYAVISFVVPFLILGLPIFDTMFAIIRRVSHGQNPMAPDRSHVHHRLIDMGLNQKQAVAVLYVISAILGLSAVVLATDGEIKAILCLVALVLVCLVAARVIIIPHLSAEERQNLKEHSLREELSELEERVREEAGGAQAAAPPEAPAEPEHLEENEEKEP